MKNTDKITLTLGQLKRLVAESTSDDSLIDKALEKVMAAGTYKESDPMICYFTEDSTITSFDFDDVRDDFEGSEEFEDFDWDDKSIENYKRFLSIVNKIEDDYNLDNCLNTPANLNKLLKKYAEDITGEYNDIEVKQGMPAGYIDDDHLVCQNCGKKANSFPEQAGWGIDTERDVYLCPDCWWEHYKDWKRRHKKR